jgi:ElaB/YqjD/DUF883 family membrane-anchored ribosome-binding protein
VLTYFLRSARGLSSDLERFKVNLTQPKNVSTFYGQAASNGANQKFLLGQFFQYQRRKIKMSEFEAEVKKAEKELEQSLVPINQYEETSVTNDEYLGDWKMQAQEYQQKFQDAAVKAKDYANEKFVQASEKFKELSNKDPKELVEDAKEFARRKPGQTILISAAVGLVLGLLLRRK